MSSAAPEGIGTTPWDLLRSYPRDHMNRIEMQIAFPRLEHIRCAVHPNETLVSPAEYLERRSHMGMNCGIAAESQRASSP